MVVGCGTAVQNKSRPSLLAPPGASWRGRVRVGDWNRAEDSLETCTLISSV